MAGGAMASKSGHRWQGGGANAALFFRRWLANPLERQRRFVEAVEGMAPGRGFLLYTYCITSPLPSRKLGLMARREAWTPLNFPPASVWRYQPRR